MYLLLLKLIAQLYDRTLKTFSHLLFFDCGHEEPDRVGGCVADAIRVALLAPSGKVLHLKNLKLGNVRDRNLHFNHQRGTIRSLHFMRPFVFLVVFEGTCIKTPRHGGECTFITEHFPHGVFIVYFI